MFPPPSLTPPTLLDFQWYYQGLTFGRDTALGVLKVEGLDLSGIRSGDVNWPRDHGQAKGLDVFEGKDIIFDLWEKSDGTSLQDEQLKLAKATNIMPNEEAPLWFQLPTLPLMCIFCRVRKRPTPIDADYAAAQVAKPELVLHSTDPRIYTAGTETPLPIATPTTVTNVGNTEMRQIVILTGPSARPFIKNKTLNGEPFIELEGPAKEEREEAEGKVREEREAAEAATKSKRVKEETEERSKWEHERAFPPPFGTITQKEYEEKLAAQTVTREAAEATEKSAREAAEATEKAAREAAEATEKSEEEAGTLLTIAAGDQVLIDFGNPHLVQYFIGGIGVGAPENALGLVTYASRWWDIVPDANELEYDSLDTGSTGTAAIQWASAYEL